MIFLSFSVCMHEFLVFMHECFEFLLVRVLGARGLAGRGRWCERGFGFGFGFGLSCLDLGLSLEE